MQEMDPELREKLQKRFRQVEGSPSITHSRAIERVERQSRRASPVPKISGFTEQQSDSSASTACSPPRQCEYYVIQSDSETEEDTICTARSRKFEESAPDLWTMETPRVIPERAESDEGPEPSELEAEASEEPETEASESSAEFYGLAQPQSGDDHGVDVSQLKSDLDAQTKDLGLIVERLKAEADATVVEIAPPSVADLP